MFDSLSDKQTTWLLTKANKYIWWQNARESILRPSRVIVQIMDIGTFEDCRELEAVFEKESLIKALRNSEAGQLRPQSWSYWHYRLGILMNASDELPPMPKRKFAGFIPEA